MQVNLDEAQRQFPRLLELGERGESVSITRHGTPVARMIPAVRRTGFPFGIAAEEPLVAPGDSWWAPMSGEEAEAWGGLVSSR